ncbi:Cloroperoxidase [Amylostereum chailletii]|nr:Cloroperoxidase [Amylostereum chailletii]
MDNPHAFVPAGPSDRRSPCPALNALANQSHLPHDGRNINICQFMRAMSEVYHISAPLGLLLSLGGVISCGNGWKVDLDDLARHDRIEHDGSLTHDDAAHGAIYAPTQPNPKLLDKLLSITQTDYLSLEDLVRVRAARDASLSKPLSKPHSIISFGEVALTSQMFSDKEGRIPKDFLRQWFGEQRLPDGWVKPSQTVGIATTTKLNNQVKASVVQVLKKGD